jgi:hypothetical protein
MTTPGLNDAMLGLVQGFVTALAMFSFGMIALSHYIPYYYVLAIIMAITIIVLMIVTRDDTCQTNKLNPR